MDSRHKNKGGTKVIEHEIKIFECPSCKKVHSVKDWDESTLSTCNNRQVRRTFKSLGFESSRDRGSKKVYVCPSCRAFTAGNKIKPSALI